VCLLSVRRRRHRMEREVKVVVGRIRGVREELVPVPLGDLVDCTAARNGGNVHDHQVRPRRIDRSRGRREPEEGAVRVLRIDPQVHLVRLNRLARQRGWHVARDERRVHGVAQVEELDVEGEGGVGSGRAVVDGRAAAEGHDHEELLLGPNTQLASGDAGKRCVRRAELADHGWIRGVGDVDDEHAWMDVHVRRGVARLDTSRVRTREGPVRAVPDVEVVAVKRGGSVHTPGVEIVVSNQLDALRRARCPTTGSDRDVAVHRERHRECENDREKPNQKTASHRHSPSCKERTGPRRTPKERTA
jgi:hypothetical protein